MTQRIAITAGEPAGIGPDIIIELAQQAHPVELVVIADRNMLQQRAALLGIPLSLTPLTLSAPAKPQQANTLTIVDIPLAEPCIPGELNQHNASAVLASLQYAAEQCLAGDFAALVTGPVHKGNLQAAGIDFLGHTEYFATLSNVKDVVMLFATPILKVALVTTHLALKDVPARITPDRLKAVIEILHTELQQRFSIEAPSIAVCGLNPHAGEEGYLGEEEIIIIRPVINALSARGINVSGPYPADTLLNETQAKQYDVILAMYHDQGLPVVKHHDFGHTANITLGLPFIRTSVDHGTALSVAGTKKANAQGMHTALTYALALIKTQRVL